MGSPDKPLLLKPLHLMNLFVSQSFLALWKDTHSFISVSDLTCSWHRAALGSTGCEPLKPLEGQDGNKSIPEQSAFSQQAEVGSGSGSPKLCSGCCREDPAPALRATGKQLAAKSGHLGRKFDLWGGFAVLSALFP